MSLDVVAGKHLEELVLRVQDGVKQKEGASFGEKCHTFHLVFVAGIAGRFPRPAAGSSMKLWLTRTVSIAAHPGRIALRPPPYPLK